MQGLATREVWLGKREGEGGRILRTQRVSVACLVPVRKGRGLGGEKKVLVSGKVGAHTRDKETDR